MVSTMCWPGRCRGKAVATRWRATGGAGHIRHDERADWLTVILSAGAMLLRALSVEHSLRLRSIRANREVGRLGLVSVAHSPWLDAVAAGSGILGEVSLAAAADDSSGACIVHAPVFAGGSLSGTTMNWRGRTVEYSGDPAKRPLVEVPCVDFV